MPQSSVPGLSIRAFRSSAKRGRRRVNWYQAVIGVVLLCATLFYAWTGATSGPQVFTAHATDVYNLMTTALLHGHLYLPIHPVSWFVHLKDPYNPAANQGVYHDLIWYRGHLYSAWGPSAALLFLLFRLVTLGSLDMPQSLAVVVYSAIGLVCATGTMHLLLRRFVPTTPKWVFVVATVGVALTNVAPFLLRRPAQYEVAISGAYCFEMAGLWLVASASLNSPKWRLKMASGSLLLGLAIAARPTMAAGGLVLCAAAWYLVRRGHNTRTTLLTAFAPFIVCGLLLGAYNVARFGSPGDFGTKYQMAGLSELNQPTDDPAYLAPGLFSYLLTPPRLQVGFPYVVLQSNTRYPWTLPANYDGGSGGWPAEPAGGLFPTMPVTLLLFALPWLVRRRHEDDRVAVLASVGLTIVGSTIVVLLSLALWGTTQRYEVDYATYFLIASFLTWAVLLSRTASRGRLRRLVTVSGLALTALGVSIGVATSFAGYYDYLAIYHPSVFNRLEDFFAPLPTLATEIAGHPMIASIDGDNIISTPTYGYFNFQESDATVGITAVPTTFVLISPSTRTYDLTATTSPPTSGGKVKKARVVVAGPTRQRYVISWPTTARSIDIPLHLQLGINRIELSLPSQSAAQASVVLSGVEIGPA